MKPYDLILENMTILTMDSAGTIIEGGIIGIENGIISLIEKKKPDNDYPANKRIDAKGMIALPGFVNTHVHCFQSLLKGLGADLPLIGWLNKAVQPFGIPGSNEKWDYDFVRIFLYQSGSGACRSVCGNDAKGGHPQRSHAYISGLWGRV